MSWSPASLPPQHGKTFVVTGGGSGIGYFIVEQLAATGARIVIAARSNERADAAAASVRSRVPSADLAFVQLDLASLDSVRRAAEDLRALGGIDGLVENAGLTGAGRARQVTADGLELFVGTNHLGHFALTALVFDALNAGARIIPMGSLATRLAKADPSDLLSEVNYSTSKAYATSKHATQTFGFELDRRLRAAGSSVQSIVAHPGFAMAGLTPRRPGINDLNLGARFAQSLMRPMAQGRDRGAWPVTRALLDPSASGGEYYGPAHAVKGEPVILRAVDQDYDPAFGRLLWHRSEEWTGTSFSIPTA